MSKKLTPTQKIRLLEQIIKDTFWMARRYAHGRHTYAPSIVRERYHTLKKYFPQLVPDYDIILEKLDGIDDTLHWHEDYLYDCNEVL